MHDRNAIGIYSGVPIAVAGSLRRLPTRPKQPARQKAGQPSFTAPAY